MFLRLLLHAGREDEHTTSADSLFHTVTTRTEKACARAFTRESGNMSLSEWPRVLVLAANLNSEWNWTATKLFIIL